MSMVATKELLESLREQVRRIETAGRPAGQSVSLGCPGLDALLPQRGIARGTIHEWLSPGGGSGAPYRDGNGAEILSLIAAREACHSGGALVVIDSTCCFYPPAAALWGIGLENTIVIRPADQRDAAWAIDQALRCSAVAAVWGYLDWIGERWLRRFQLSAEQSGCLGLFVRPISVARRVTWSESQWLCRGLSRRVSTGPRGTIPSPLQGTSFIPSPSWGGLGRGETDSHSIPMRQNPAVSSPQSEHWQNQQHIAAHFSSKQTGVGEDRLIQVRLARLRGGAAGASLTLRIDFQTGSVQVARRDDEANRVRLSRRLAHPTIGRKTARA